MKKIMLLLVTTLVLWGSLLFTHTPSGGDEFAGYVFLKTFDRPNGTWLPMSTSDETPVVQFWHHTQGYYYMLHESGVITYADTETFRARIK